MPDSITDTPAPPPWRLTGRGYIQLLHCSRAFGDACRRDGSGFTGEALGGTGAAMLIDYLDSDVGPYRELLLCPGRFRIGRRRVRAVTHIWVSTDASASNGRRNWGLPKKTAIFEAEPHADGRQTVRVHRPGRPALALTFAPGGPALPAHTGILPPSLRTLEQPWQGQLYRTRITARGRIGYARLSDYENAGNSGFPDFGGQRWLLAMAAPAFDLVFPTPLLNAIRPE